MSKDEAAKQVVLLAMQELLADGLRGLNLHVDQEPLRRQVESILGIIPGMRLLKNNHRIGLRTSLRARQHLDSILNPLFSERDKRLHEEETRRRLASISEQRALYVNASLSAGGAQVGYGYVIKDIFTDPDTGEQHWELAYSAALTGINKSDVRTGAELQAILETLKTPGVLNKDIRTGARSMTVLSSSEWGIELINAVKHGTQPRIREKIKESWWGKAERIIRRLDGIENVEFQLVKGHGSDPLNDAADRLALSQRRNSDLGVSLEVRETMKENIISDTLDGLKARGVTAVARGLQEGSVR
jgi:ribonuclease HI